MNAAAPPPYEPPYEPPYGHPFPPAPGTPPMGAPETGAAGPQEPVPAGPGRRAAAWSLDFALVIVVAVSLGAWTWSRISALITGIPEMAANGVWTVLSSRGDIKVASTGFGLSLWNQAVGYVVQAFAALVVIVFVYHLAALAWKGRTLGMLALDLRVEPHRRASLGKGQALARALAATVTDIGLYAVACCLLVKGWFVLSVACWLLAVAVFWVNVLPALFPGHRSLLDRMAGTRVARAHLYRAAAEQVMQGGRLALQGAQRLTGDDRVQRVHGLGRDAAGKGRQALEKAKRSYADRKGDAPPAIAPAQPPFQQQPYGQPYGQPYDDRRPQDQPPRVPSPEEQ